jgi:hypothetical protein
MSTKVPLLLRIIIFRRNSQDQGPIEGRPKEIIIKLYKKPNKCITETKGFVSVLTRR